MLGVCILTNFVLPICVAVVTYLISRKLDDWSKRRRNRKLAKARIESYLSDVNAGLSQIANLLTKPGNIKMPCESWDAVKLSDDLLFEIIALKGPKTNSGFHPDTVLIRLKDYFEHVCPNVETFGNSTGYIRVPCLQNLQNAGNTVKSMLECIVCQLRSSWWQFWK